MEHMDAIAIIEAKQRQKEADKAAQAALERQQLEEQNNLHADKVPDMARDLLHELTVLYGELREEAGPEFTGNNPQVIKVPQPAPAQPKTPFWKRLLGMHEPILRADPKKVAVWWGIATAKAGDDWLRLHVGVDDGVVYAQHGITYVSFDEAYLLQLSYTTLQTLLEDVARKRRSINFDREQREFERQHHLKHPQADAN